ncbi:Histidine kinase [Thiomonas sp. CB2]|nr:Histidine kinase [Thiomonas sp. CB2]CQR42602.1 Histidine kinase [Thiomonas sp. CB3]VDY05387.1 Histidine kinase [Thiomonas sp. Bio17B3]VDY07448.1 Histidine kinase [Thiomonas sp. Sup16B3]VDY13638.1 putative two-component sensor [Thiomonas sp. OC7]
MLPQRHIHETPDHLADLASDADLTHGARPAPEGFTDLRALVDQLPGFVFRLRHDGGQLRFDFASACCLPVCGVQATDLQHSAQHLLNQIDPLDLAPFHEALQASVASGFWNWEGRLHTPHGLKWVNVRARTRSINAFAAESTGIMLNVTQSHLRESQLLNLSSDLRRIASHLESVREAERARMARDLHDDLGQVLTALQMDVALLRKQFGAAQAPELFGNIDKLIHAAAEAGRRVASELRPSVLDLGLKAALRWMSEQYAQRYDIRVSTELSYKSEVGELIATELFRIAQEGLTNVVRHARARQAWVRCVDVEAHQICISVEDDGIGYTPQEPPASRPSLGLRGMRERAAVFGGSFQLDQSPRGGVRVQVCMPLGPTLSSDDAGAAQPQPSAGDALG